MVRSAEASGVARGVVSEWWTPCPFYLGLGVQGHWLPSTPQSPTQLSQQALGIGQETGFRGSEATSSGFRRSISHQLRGNETTLAGSQRLETHCLPHCPAPVSQVTC